MSDLAGKYGIGADRPIWELADDFEQNLDIMSRGFIPKVLEPKCLAGRPCGPPTDAELDSMLSYFHDRLWPMLPELVEGLLPVFRASPSRHRPSLRPMLPETKTESELVMK